MATPSSRTSLPPITVGGIKVYPRRHAAARGPCLKTNIETGKTVVTFPRDERVWTLDLIKAWLWTKEPEVKRHASIVRDNACPIADGASIPIFGQDYIISAIDGIEWPRIDGSRLLAPRQGLEQAVRDYLRLELINYAEYACMRYAMEMDTEYGQLELDELANKWGYHQFLEDEGERRDIIMLDWRLIGAPKATIDAICCHEVAHTHEQNHSPAFWAHVYRSIPKDEYKAAEAMIHSSTELGCRIRRYGRG